MNIEIPYGHGNKKLIHEDEKNVTLISPNEKDVTKSLEKKIIFDSLDKECRLNDLSTINISQKSAGIVVSDPTRPLPNGLILPPLMEKLHNIGFNSSKIRFYIATGTHKGLSTRELSDLLSPDIVKLYRTVVHDCDNNDELTYLGKSTRKTPIYINKEFFDSDLKIVIGHIEPHHFMGFSGGAKSAVIGLGGRETIETNHSWITDKNAKMGLFNQNPMRMDVEEIGKIIKIDFAWNFILNSKKQIIYALFGSPDEIMLSGIKKSIKLCQVEEKAVYDLVIASPGGFPKDINLYQSQKAVTHACTFLKESGVVILVAECSEGVGNNEYREFFDGKETCEQVISSFMDQPFKIGPHKAYLFAIQIKDHPIIIVSGISPHIIRKMHLTPAKSITEALALAYELTPKNRKIAVLPYATHTIANQQVDLNG